MPAFMTKPSKKLKPKDRLRRKCYRKVLKWLDRTAKATPAKTAARYRRCLKTGR